MAGPMEDADPDVVEISPLSLPPSHFTRKRKQKQAVLAEIIDVDEYDSLTDAVILDENARRKGKGKAIEDENDVKVQDVIYVPPRFWKSTSTPNMKKWTSSQHGGTALKDSHVSGSVSPQDILAIGKEPLARSTRSKTGGSKGPVAPSSARGQPGVPSALNDEILRKLKLFKHFDIVEGHSDHQFQSSSSKQTEKKWAKRIQDEWKILEKDLPGKLHTVFFLSASTNSVSVSFETIYVRAYESRMDLMRAVIVGADGTPYHDGLFFFDIFFPASYPSVPPKVHYHSGGLRLNPNLYANGYVCLSLLGTWRGSNTENWQPRFSNVMQVLLSIQALILNQKPYFNEPGWEPSKGTTTGEMMSLEYNERTLLLSLKTMGYSMRKPPKHFEDFVMGHFHSRAKDITVACKAYMSGAQVGCLLKGGIQDLEEGDKTCSPTFKSSLPAHMDMLVKAFTELGVKNL
ncbi:unnamed protein product [Linum tenue]|uniref:UBC core domain-containing protein n=1 Tax=Linum tenue TaxID=586396 RepID=A0AAV0JK48_9ROSI|nr:unnamed protein product [Linum tenue]